MLKFPFAIAIDIHWINIEFEVLKLHFILYNQQVNLFHDYILIVGDLFHSYRQVWKID